MVKTIKLTNPYAQQLDRMVMEAKMEELDEETENQDLKNYLTEQVDGQINLLNQICKDEKRRNAQHTSVFATFMSVI